MLYRYIYIYTQETGTKRLVWSSLWLVPISSIHDMNNYKDRQTGIALEECGRITVLNQYIARALPPPSDNTIVVYTCNLRRFEPNN